MKIKEISRNEEVDKSCLRLSIFTKDFSIKKLKDKVIVNIENISDNELLELGKHIEAIRQGKYTGFSQ